MSYNRRILNAILSVLRNLFATIVGIVAGGIVAIALVVAPLEAFHTKNGLVYLIVFAIGIYGGCVSALFVRRVMLSWLLSLPGCSQQPDGRAIENSIKPLSSDELRLVADIREQTVADLRTRYSIDKDVDSAAVLQHLIEDGSFAETTDMMPLGIVWGELVCRESDAEWVSAEWDGTRMFALNVPNTTILLFPIAMLEKRRDRNEAVDFPVFLKNTVDGLRR